MEDDLINMDHNEGSLDEFEVVEQQIAQAPTPEPEVPDKYKGKSVADIIRMHQEAEKVIGRQAQEVGEVRSLADQLIKKQIQPSVPVQVDAPIDDIDFFADPVKTVNSVIANHPIVQQALEKGVELDRLTNKQRLKEAHPDYLEILQDPDFAAFVGKSPIRQQLFVAADRQYDFAAANELLSTYKELRETKQKIVQEGAAELKQESQRQLKAMSVDAGGSGDVGRKTYRRADLIRLKMYQPERYNELSEDIYRAYQEGRVR